MDGDALVALDEHERFTLSAPARAQSVALEARHTHGGVIEMLAPVAPLAITRPIYGRAPTPAAAK